MRSLITLFAVGFLIVTAGCGNLSPRFEPKLDEKINNQNGKIEEMEHIQNGIKNEMANLKQKSEMTDSQLDKVQQGVANFQNSNQFQGVQIFSGSGGLIAGCLVCCLLVFYVFYYRHAAVMNGKTADILAEKIAKHEDSTLKENVFKAAMYTDVEEHVYGLIKKHQR